MKLLNLLVPSGHQSRDQGQGRRQCRGLFGGSIHRLFNRMLEYKRRRTTGRTLRRTRVSIRSLVSRLSGQDIRREGYEITPCQSKFDDMGKKDMRGRPKSRKCVPRLFRLTRLKVLQRSFASFPV